MTELLERDDELTRLASAWEAAVSGTGSMAFVTGEPGAGKTSLLRAAVAGVPRHAVLWGACDPLTTPRPLGPVHDFAHLVGSVRDRLAAGAPLYEVSQALFDEMQASPHFVVVDDLQWADEATIDLLRFLVRRIEAARSLVVCAYRDEEVGPVHVLRGLLGDLSRHDSVQRLALRPLSADAIGGLMPGVDTQRVRHLTGGNPFFVTQIADNPGSEGLPMSVRDAVLARTAGLESGDREVLELLSCGPEAIPDIALAKLSIDLPTLRRLDAAGLIERGRRGLAFRHELCRIAIHETLPPGAEVQLHARILDALEATGAADEAFMTYHAVGTGDPARIWTHATAAGAIATRSGSHTEAAAFYRTALEHGDAQPEPVRAAVLEQLASEYFALGRMPEAIASGSAALRILEAEEDWDSVVRVLNDLAVTEWYNANRPAAESYVAGAEAAFRPETAASQVPLATVHTTDAYLALYIGDMARTRELSARAASIAATADDPELDMRLTTIEASLGILEGRTEHRDLLMAGIETAIARGLDVTPSTGWSNLVYLDVEQRRFAQADALLARSLSFAVERDLPICTTWQLGVRGRLHMLRGEWEAAVDDASQVLEWDAAALTRTWPLLVRGLVALRRGDPEARRDIDEAWELADRFGEPLRLLPAVAALAEQAWLTGRPDRRLAGVGSLVAATRQVVGTGWSLGDLAVWLRRIEVEVDLVLDMLPDPHRVHLAGDPVAAAETWGALGARYEQALALLDAGGAEHAGRGIEILDLIGADAVASKARQDLRRVGVTALPPRPRPSTRANPAGLTVRQLDVLRLVADGLTNAEIADRLFISRKTTDHHVSAILTKLGASSRSEAATIARSLGIVDGS